MASFLFAIMILASCGGIKKMAKNQEVLKLWNMLNLPGSVHEAKWSEAKELTIKPGHEIKKPQPLFKKLPPDFLEKVNDILLEARRKAHAKRPKVLE